jgi:acetyl esterase/lipase
MTATGKAQADATPRAAATEYRWPSRERLSLWPGDAPGHEGYRAPTLPHDWPQQFLRGIERPELHVFRPAEPVGRALLVCPGGAYLFVSRENEGLDVARAFNALGVTVFVLTYRLPCEGWHARADVPLQDAQRAIRLIRHRATQFGIDPDQVGVMGFSAGGHLAATLATSWQDAVYAPRDTVDLESARPAHAALIYPVITLTSPLGHADSTRNLLGEAPQAALVAHRSPEQRVDAKTPRVFLAHAADDDVVPVAHAELMHGALSAAGVSSEMHLFERGDHAFGIGRPGTGSALWPALYEAFWRNRLA